MELLIQGNFLGLIKAELFVSASYSLSFVGAQFYVRVTVDLSGINNVRKILQCVYHLVTKARTSFCILLHLYVIMLIREEFSNKSGSRENTYMLFTGWEVRIVKNCDRGQQFQVRGHSSSLYGPTLSSQRKKKKKLNEKKLTLAFFFVTKSHSRLIST